MGGGLIQHVHMVPVKYIAKKLTTMHDSKIKGKKRKVKNPCAICEVAARSLSGLCVLLYRMGLLTYCSGSYVEEFGKN